MMENGRECKKKMVLIRSYITTCPYFPQGCSDYVVWVAQAMGWIN